MEEKLSIADIVNWAYHNSGLTADPSNGALFSISLQGFITAYVEQQKAEVSVELNKYKKAYNILMEYFDSISDEEQPKVHKKLNKLGL